MQELLAELDLDAHTPALSVVRAVQKLAPRDGALRKAQAALGRSGVLAKEGSRKSFRPFLALFESQRGDLIGVRAGEARSARG